MHGDAEIRGLTSTREADLGGVGSLAGGEAGLGSWLDAFPLGSGIAYPAAVACIGTVRLLFLHLAGAVTGNVPCICLLE